MKKIKCYLLILVLIIPLKGLSQSVTDDIRVKDAFNLAEKWIESQHAYEQIPGLAITFVYKQDVIQRYAVGFSDLEKKTPTSTKTIHRICSISKLFTSIALMQLRDQGLLRLDDPPMELTKLKHIEGNKFRRVRKDGDIGEGYMIKSESDQRD